MSLSLILAIVFPVISVALFKEFEKREVNSLQAIIFNYFGAVIIGLFLFITPNQLTEINSQPWFYSSIFVGFLFLLNFYLIAKAAIINGISIATFSNKISLIIPVLFTVIYLNESLTYLKWIGILLALGSIYLITRSNNQEENNRMKFVFPLLIFLFTGILESLINWTQKTHFQTSDEVSYFTISSFGISLVFGILILLIQWKKIELKNLIAGLILSVPNTLGVFFFIQALNQNSNSSSILPVLHIGSLTLAVVIGYFVYKEKINRINLIGIGVAIAAIILLQLNFG